MKTLLFAALLLVATLAASAQQSPLGIYPHPKAGFLHGAGFSITAASEIVVPDDASPATQRAAARLQSRLKARTGRDVSVVPESRDDGAGNIYFAVSGASASIDALARATMPPGEPLPGAGGYVLDVSPVRVVIGGADEEGLFSAVATLEQLVAADGSVRGAHVWDYPDYPVRWVFNQANLRVGTTIATLRGILDTMAALKLNAMQQNDFKYNILQMQPQHYFDSARSYRRLSEERGIGVVPGVAGIGYSEGILWNDPNLAEGFHAISRYVIEADTGRLIPDARVAIPNGGLESVDANGKFTGWSYYDATLVPDRSIVHGGSVSAKGSSFTGGNSRFIRSVQCRPHSAYLMTAWMRTEDLRGGELRLLAIGQDSAGNTGRSLAYTMYALPATTNGWRKVQVVFNTLEYPRMYVYAGLWGGTSGAFWVDDIEIQEHGLANVLRRDGAPVHVRSTSGAREYREGIDFDSVIDRRMTNGVVTWHQPPTFRRTTSGALRNGDTVDISYFHPVTVYGNEDGIGSVMVCVSEDTLYSIIRDQVERVDALYDAPQYFMGHDEIRAMNQDSACLARGLSPAELLADNVNRCVAIIDSVHPGAAITVWSDMFDSLHNAHDDYFLVNGDLGGVWNMIPKSLTIANWNGGQKMRQSLDFFAQHGFRQIASPYYDERGTRSMRTWRIALETTPNAMGMMYTTWASDFDYLRPFAYYAWGAGPNIVHRPLDTTVLVRAALDPVRIAAQITRDPFDATDSIMSAVAEIDLGGSTETVQLLHEGDGVYAGLSTGIARGDFRYSIATTNAQGLRRETPQYIVARAATSGVERVNGAHLAVYIRPNPIVGAGTITFVAPHAGSWTMTLVDALGRTAYTREGSANASEHVTITLDADAVATGTYRCEVRMGQWRAVRALGRW